jgi:hypothetical protein
MVVEPSPFKELGCWLSLSTRLFLSLHVYRFQFRCSQQAIKEFPAIHEVFL